MPSDGSSILWNHVSRNTLAHPLNDRVLAADKSSGAAHCNRDASRFSLVSYPELSFQGTASNCRCASTSTSSARPPSGLNTPARRNPFVQNGANVGRRRANAVALANSPARRSHSQEMARIFQQAQETIVFQEKHARLRQESRDKALLPLTPRRAIHAGPAVIKPALPVDEAPRCQGYLPSLSPVGRLSEDLPENMRPEVKVSPKCRDRPCPNVGSVGARPTLEAIESPIQKWLDGIDPSEPCSAKALHRAEKSSFSSPSTTTSSRSSTLRGTDDDPDAYRSGSGTACENGAGLMSPPRRTIRSLLDPKIGPKKLKLQRQPKGSPSAPRRDLPTRYHPAKVPTRPLREGRTQARRVGVSISPPAKGSHESLEASPVHADVRSADDVGNGASRMDNQHQEKEVMRRRANGVTHPSRFEDGARRDERLAELSPNVEKLRKGKSPRVKQRCPSYFDEDVLPELSPSRRAAMDLESALSTAGYENVAP